MTKLLYQDYGTAILVFIKGESRDEAYWKWVSLANWGATTFNDPDWVQDTICSCWSTVGQLKEYLFNLRLGAMDGSARDFKGVKGGFADKAREQALAEFAAIPVEHYRSVNDQICPCDIGVISAEKPDEDFASSVLAYALSNRE